MYEDLNEIAALRFNKELESISSQTRERVKETQDEYAALTDSSGARSGPQEAAIGRAQIEGSERLMRALFDIWVDLVKRRNGHISHPDVDFIAKKLEGFAQTQKGHLHGAFSSQRMGAVVNLLTEEAGRRLYAATASARRDLAIMVREHELFSRSADASKQQASEAAPADEDGHHRYTIERPAPADPTRGHHPEGNNILSASKPSIERTIWAQIWSWSVVGVIVPFALAGGIAFMTSEHPWAADGFYAGGIVLFLIKFWTWEDARQQPRAPKQALHVGVTLLALIVVGLAVLWNHTINRVTSTPPLKGSPAVGTEATRGDPAHAPGGSAPIESKPEEPSQKVRPPGAEVPTISVADRVKIIIAGHLQVNAAQLKSTDDFEANLGADPQDVYFLMRSLEQEYNITIPATDSRNLHTVGEAIGYIEKKVQKRQEHERTILGKSVFSDATPTTGSDAATPTVNKTPALRYILESDFEDEVIRQTGPVLVFFCTESQDPCRVMAPTISSIAQKHREKLKTIAIDVNINKNLPKKYDAGYFEVPVTILFTEGTEKGRITGAASEKAVEHLIVSPQAFESKKSIQTDPLETITNVPESDFNDRVLRAGVPVLVYFYSPDDASKQVSPLVSRVASAHKGDIRVVKVDSYTESHLTRCLVPAFDGAYFSREWKEALWDRYFTGAPQRQRRKLPEGPQGSNKRIPLISPPCGSSTNGAASFEPRDSRTLLISGYHSEDSSLP
jgi:acyl carrier protein